MSRAPFTELYHLLHCFQKLSVALFKVKGKEKLPKKKIAKSRSLQSSESKNCAHWMFSLAVVVCLKASIKQVNPCISCSLSHLQTLSKLY